MESISNRTDGPGRIRPVVPPSAKPIASEVAKAEFEATDADRNGLVTRDELLQSQAKGAASSQNAAQLNSAFDKLSISKEGVTGLTEAEFAQLLGDDTADYRFQRPEADTGKTWGDPSFTRPLNYGHDAKDGAVITLHPTGVPVWADNGKAISADQFANMPKFQQNEILKLVPSDQVAEFTSAMDKGNAASAKTEPPESAKAALKQEQDWGLKHQEAAAAYQTMAERFQTLVKTQGAEKVVADPVPPPFDPSMMQFKPNMSSPSMMFFNHRESLYPHQLGADWREIQRAPEGLKLDAAAPANFKIGAEHENMGNHAAELGVRLTNNGSEPLTVKLSDFRFMDEPYGYSDGDRFSTLLDERLDKNGTATVTIPPGESLNLPMVRTPDKSAMGEDSKKNAIGAYEFKAEVVSGNKTDLAVKEIARFDKPANPNEVIEDPWQSAAVGGERPHLTIYNDNGKRTGLPEIYKTHQEFVGPELFSELMTVPKGASFKVDAHNYGPASTDDFAGRDRGYAYHVDHVARFTLPDGLPKAFRFKGEGTNPQLSQERLKTPDGEKVTLGGKTPSVEIPAEYLLDHQPNPWLTRTGDGPDAVYEMRISIPNGSNGLVEVEPIY